MQHNPAVDEQLFAFAEALYRFASFTHERALAESLKEISIMLTSALAQEDYARVAKTLSAIQRLSVLAQSTRTLRNEDAEVIRMHADKLRLALADQQLARVPFSGLLSEALPSVMAQAPKLAPALQPRPIQQKPQQQNPAKPMVAESGNPIRKEAIMKIVIKNGSIRMKELQKALPNVSERTLRYDIEELIKSGRLERVGNSGPATFYQIPEKSGTKTILS